MSTAGNLLADRRYTTLGLAANLSGLGRVFQETIGVRAGDHRRGDLAQPLLGVLNAAIRDSHRRNDRARSEITTALDARRYFRTAPPNSGDSPEPPGPPCI
ncbi:hypothetical protein GCM10022262_41530 [Georgenia daeguensis]|uniref:Uncharacterized protein n=1 Tax=Georgenia daeguensis TaxID=908355 RepID=A0ABP6URF2_9MICO